MLKGNNKKLERRHCIALVSLLLTLSIFHTFFQCFYCWLWTCKYLIGTKIILLICFFNCFLFRMDNGYIYISSNKWSNCNLNWINPRLISCHKGQNLALIFIDLSSKFNFDFAQVKGCSALSTTWKQTFLASDDTLIILPKLFVQLCHHY